MDIGSLILTGLTLLGGGGAVGAGINARANRKKLGADAASVITKTALDLLKAQTEEIVKPLQEKVRELEAEVAEARGEVAEARGEVATLRQTVRETTAELETCRTESRAKDARIRKMQGARQ